MAAHNPFILLRILNFYNLLLPSHLPTTTHLLASILQLPPGNQQEWRLETYPLLNQVGILFESNARLILLRFLLVCPCFMVYWSVGLLILQLITCQFYSQFWPVYLKKKTKRKNQQQQQQQQPKIEKGTNYFLPSFWIRKTFLRCAIFG